MLKLQNETKITRDVKYLWTTLDYPVAHIQTGETIKIFSETDNSTRFGCYIRLLEWGGK